MGILGVTLGQEWHYICDSSTLYMHPGDETFVKTLESAAAVSMESLGVTLEQEWAKYSQEWRTAS